jgi:hypothetical protein
MVLGLKEQVGVIHEVSCFVRSVIFSFHFIYFERLFMANSVISPIESSRNNSVAASAIPTNNMSSGNMTNNLADSISKSLTDGGRSSFETPGAQQDFQKGMRSAIADMVKGGESGDMEQMMKGVTAMLGLLSGLAKPTGSDSPKESASGNESGNPSKASDCNQAASSPAAGSSEEDKKKKLLELIQMLLSMGVSPEMITQLLQSMGMSSSESQQLLSQASQGAPQGSTQSSDSANNSSYSNTNKNALAA